MFIYPPILGLMRQAVFRERYCQRNDLNGAVSTQLHEWSMACHVEESTLTHYGDTKWWRNELLWFYAFPFLRLYFSSQMALGVDFIVSLSLKFDCNAY
jgi:hypothetical protein